VVCRISSAMGQLVVVTSKTRGELNGGVVAQELFDSIARPG